MNWIDFAILGLLLGGFLWSFRHGFIMEVIYFVAAFVGLLGAFVLYPSVTPLTKMAVSSSTAASSVSFAGLFVLFAGAVTVLGTLFHKFIYMIHLGIFDRLLGGLFGAVKVAMVISVALVMFVGVQGKDTPEYIENSTICQPVVNTATGVLESVPPLFRSFHQDYGQSALDWLQRKREQVGPD